MKLTKSDKDVLIGFGFNKKDIPQIEKAVFKTDYSINYKDEISPDEAYELLGQEVFLSGLGRSAFHWSSLREISGSDDVVSFDSSRLFK